MPAEDIYRGPNGELPDGYCGCRAVLSMWCKGYEAPRIVQGVMHSPVGCLRRVLQVHELRALYYDLTGFTLDPGVNDLYQCFQIVMSILNRYPDLKEAVQGRNRTLPRSRIFNHEVTSNPVGSRGGGRVVRGTFAPTPSNLPVKPPWEDLNCPQPVVKVKAVVAPAPLDLPIKPPWEK